jgi:hypothetical protein
MKTTHRLSIGLLLSGVVALSACGDYISTDDYQPGGGGGGTIELSGAPKTLSHSTFSMVMSRYTVDNAGQALFDYNALATDPEARFMLDQYMALVAAVDPAKLETPAERFAYFVNGYNAGVIKGVIDNYNQDPSFKVTDSGLFFDGPNYTFGGLVLSLNQVENVVARGDFNHPSASGLRPETETTLREWHEALWPDGKVDARLHAAFNCGAISCPNLLTEAPHVYTAATLETQLETNTKRWLDSEKGANANGISKLFDWYKADFEAHSGSVDAFITAYRKDGVTGINTGAYLEYDWTLNITGVQAN